MMYYSYRIIIVLEVIFYLNFIIVRSTILIRNEFAIVFAILVRSPTSIRNKLGIVFVSYIYRSPTLTRTKCVFVSALCPTHTRATLSNVEVNMFGFFCVLHLSLGFGLPTSVH